MESEKKPIAPIFQEMKVGEVQKYPKMQYYSLRMTAYRMRIVTGRRWSVKIGKDCVNVTREQ